MIEMKLIKKIDDILQNNDEYMKDITRKNVNMIDYIIKTA